MATARKPKGKTAVVKDENITAESGRIITTAKFKLTVGDYENTTQGIVLDLPADASEARIKGAVDIGEAMLEASNKRLATFLERHGYGVEVVEGEEEEEEGEENSSKPTLEELKEMTAKALRDLCKEEDIYEKGMNKEAAFEALVEHFDFDEDEEEAEDDEEDPDADEEEEEEDDELEEEDEEEEDEIDFESMTRIELRAFNKENELGVKFTKGKSDDDVRAEVEEAYAEIEEEDDKEEDEETDGDEDARREELEAMKIAELREVALENGIKAAKKKAATLIEEILEAEFEKDELEEDDDEEVEV